MTPLMPTAAVLTLGAALLAACSTTSAPPAPAVPDAPWVGEAREVSKTVPLKLLGVLTQAIDSQGPAGAIEVCQEQAPQLAKAASAQTGWQVRRVSLKNRNPHAVPDAWERDALQWFEQAQARGVPAAELERASVVQENGQPVRRYIRALPTAQLCVQCHGPAHKLGPGVAERLARLYPADKGIGFTEGQIRGAITLRQVSSTP